VLLCDYCNTNYFLKKVVVCNWVANQKRERFGERPECKVHTDHVITVTSSVISRNLNLGGYRQMFREGVKSAKRKFTLKNIKNSKKYTEFRGGGVVSQLGVFTLPRGGGCKNITGVIIDWSTSKWKPVEGQQCTNIYTDIRTNIHLHTVCPYT